MVNIFAAEGIRRVGDAESVKIFVGGLPQNPEPPLNYQIVYSLEGALDYYTTPSWILREGRPERVDALSELEDVPFPNPVGTLEAFHTGGGISTMPWAYSGKVRTMEYKTLRYPGHAAIMRPIREMGLLSLDPVRVRGTEIVPRDAFIAAVSPQLSKPNGRDLVALRVEVRGKSGARVACSVTVTPVRRWARPAARSTRSSEGVIHVAWAPISPMIPARTSLPSMPSVMSATIWSATWSVRHRCKYGS